MYIHSELDTERFRGHVFLAFSPRGQSIRALVGGFVGGHEFPQGIVVLTSDVGCG